MRSVERRNRRHVDRHGGSFRAGAFATQTVPSSWPARSRYLTSAPSGRRPRCRRRSSPCTARRPRWRWRTRPRCSARSPVPPWGAGRAARTGGTPGEVVVDSSRGDVLLELGEGRRGIGPVEPADRHHRVAGRELVARCRVGAGGRCDPRVARGIPLEQRGELPVPVSSRRAARPRRRGHRRPRRCRSLGLRCRTGRAHRAARRRAHRGRSRAAERPGPPAPPRGGARRTPSHCRPSPAAPAKPRSWVGHPRRREDRACVRG